MIKSILSYFVLIIPALPFYTFAEETILQPGEKPFIIPRASCGANAQYNSKTDTGEEIDIKNFSRDILQFFYFFHLHSLLLLDFFQELYNLL